MGKEISKMVSESSSDFQCVGITETNYQKARFEEAIKEIKMYIISNGG